MSEPFLLMIVDDNANNRFALRTILAEMADLEVIEAPSGSEALLRTVDRAVNLFLMDVQMPDMDGFETASHLQMTARTRDIPIIFLTAVFKAGDFVKRGYALGAVDYLVKPLDANLIQNRVRLYQHLHEREIKLMQAMDLLRLQDQALGMALDNANAANFAKGTFLANMSHEIRTPMNAIIGMTHLVLQTGLTEKQRQYLDRTHDAAVSLLGIINDILDFSKIEAGKLQIDHEGFLLEEVLEKAARLVTMKAAEKGLELLLDVDFDVPSALMGDPMRLGQVLTNLLSNAVKFTDRGEILIGIKKLRAEGDQVKLQFTIQDTGIGMTPEQAALLFQPFGQVDPSSTRRFIGTGLGLAICKHLVTMMCGEIWVESVPGEGSAFAFTTTLALGPPLPLAKPADPRLEPGLNVLVVDDHPTVRRLLKTQLASFGYQVRTAASLPEALEHLREIRCDLALLDFHLPGGLGLEHARQIRSLAPRVILMTAQDSVELQSQLEAEGLGGCLSKPVTASRLQDAIARVFGLPVTRPRLPSARALPGPADLARLRGARVLLVEDNEFNQQVGSELLALMGVEVILARNGAEALAAISAQSFDAVLMDLQMPVMDGYEATRRLREDPALAAMPILAMTAHAMQQERDRCRELGMNDYITKPIDPELLALTLAKWIQRSGSADAGPAAPEHGAVLVTELGLASFMGNVPMYEKMLKRVLELHEPAQASLRRACTDGDWAAAARHAHSMVSAAGTIGALELAASAQALERALHAGVASAAVTEGVGRFEVNLAAVLAAIRPRVIH